MRRRRARAYILACALISLPLIPPGQGGRRFFSTKKSSFHLHICAQVCSFFLGHLSKKNCRLVFLNSGSSPLKGRGERRRKTKTKENLCERWKKRKGKKMREQKAWDYISQYGLSLWQKSSSLSFLSFFFLLLFSSALGKTFFLCLMW